ncbi:MAG: GNAT family N-acetyltransferase [Planctomycetota bacterium]
MIRRATPDDLDALLGIEHRAFSLDRFSRRGMRHLLTRGHATTFVDVEQPGGRIIGYITLLYRRGSRAAHIYSIAVDPLGTGQRHGTGRGLLQAAEQDAIEHGCNRMRLEVRCDNAASLAFFTRAGYSETSRYDAYYEDGMQAVMFARDLPTAVAASAATTAAPPAAAAIVG